MRSIWLLTQMNVDARIRYDMYRKETYKTKDASNWKKESKEIEFFLANDKIMCYE